MTKVPTGRPPGRPRKNPPAPVEPPAPKVRSPRRTSAELDEAIVPGTLAHRILGLMRERRISAKDLSLRAGLSADAVRALIRGRIESPRNRSITQIAAALGLSLDQLMEGTSMVPASVREAAIAAGDVLEAEVAEYDLRVRGDATTPSNPRSLTARRKWRIPLDLLEERVLDAASLLIVRVATGGVDGYAIGDRLLVDTSARRATGGVSLVHDGGVHSLVQTRASVRGAMSWSDASGTPRDEEIIGRVVGRWNWID